MGKTQTSLVTERLAEHRWEAALCRQDACSFVCSADCAVKAELQGGRHDTSNTPVHIQQCMLSCQEWTEHATEEGGSVLS